ncbi:MAG: hypothetical protein GWP14_08655 [Actinobacteria bacterium]|nr:hypothetical protein [Actinomycetota bacterium]
MPTAIQREAQAIKSEARKILLIVVIISLLIYAFTGTAQVSPEQTGLVIRFGRVVQTRKPGLYWGLPWPIDRVVRIPTGVSHSLEVKDFNLDPEHVSSQQAALRQNIRFRTLPPATLSALANPHLVTGDMNVIHLDMQVVYQITNPVDYYEAAGDVSNMSETNVQQIARRVLANALMQAVANMEVMNVLSEGQTAIKYRVHEIARRQFKQLKLGIDISQPNSIRITTCRVPTSLQEVFNNVTTAQEANRYLKNTAQADRKQLLNEAQAQVAQIRTEAETYSQTTIRQAQGNAKRFKALIAEYHAQGEVVRDRLRYEKLAELAPYLKAPTVYTVPNSQGSQRLVITIPGEPE